MPNLNAIAQEVYIGKAVPNLSASTPVLQLQPLALANTPPATRLLAPPQSPSGSVTGQASTWEFTNSQLAATYYTTNLNGTDGMVNPSPLKQVTPGTAPNGPSVGNKIDSQTLPTAPTGSYVMSGAASITNLLAITSSFAGVPAAQIAVFNYGAQGNI